MKLNANRLPIDEYNEHDLPDAERKRIINDLVAYKLANPDWNVMHEVMALWYEESYEYCSDEEIQKAYEAMLAEEEA